MRARPSVHGVQSQFGALLCSRRATSAPLPRAPPVMKRLGEFTNAVARKVVQCRLGYPNGATACTPRWWPTSTAACWNHPPRRKRPKIQHCDLLSLPVGATKQDLLRANCFGFDEAPVRSTDRSQRLYRLGQCLAAARTGSGFYAVVAGNKAAIRVVDYAGQQVALRPNVTVANCSITRRSADHVIAVDSFELR